MSPSASPERPLPTLSSCCLLHIRRRMACVRARVPPRARACARYSYSCIHTLNEGAHMQSSLFEFHCIYYYTLFASLTGLPAQLTGAAPVSRVCQVFGLKPNA